MLKQLRIKHLKTMTNWKTQVPGIRRIEPKLTDQDNDRLSFVHKDFESSQDFHPSSQTRHTYCTLQASRKEKELALGILWMVHLFFMTWWYLDLVGFGLRDFNLKRFSFSEIRLIINWYFLEFFFSILPFHSYSLKSLPYFNQAIEHF